MSLAAEEEEMSVAAFKLQKAKLADQVLNNTALVLTGPVVGAVTATSAVILLEVDEPSSITCIFKSVEGKYPEVRVTRDFPAHRPRAFLMDGLTPDTSYSYTFEGIAPSHVQEIVALDPLIKTFPLKITKVRLAVLSCDQPRRMIEGDENPWGRLNALCDNNQCDVMLHLGDQVYTKMDGFLERAEMKMSAYDLDVTTDHSKAKMRRSAEEELRGAYRYVWNQPATRATLAKSSHLMIWSDNDVANDFTEKVKKGTEEQYYPENFIMCAMKVYTGFQRQLWDPSCEGKLPHWIDPTKAMENMEEWHFHQYGGLGVFMVDMRGNRITSNGTMQSKRALMSDKQINALKDAFNNPDISCMIIASEIPFVTSEPSKVKENAQKVKFLEGHWCHDEVGTGALFDMCFEWKSAKPGRDVLLMGGDVHTGFTTDLSCKKTGLSIRAVTTSPITNHVCAFFETVEGDFNENYHFKHTHYPDKRNFCVLEANFDDEGKCILDVNMELIPATPDH